MKRKVLVLLMVAMVAAGAVHADVVINEVLADPAPEMAGDANGDGIRSAYQDEFIELMNTGTEAANVSGWSLQDGRKTRHVFPDNSIISPNGYLVVFGGAESELTKENWQVASAGSLGLDNSKDTIILLDQDQNIIDRLEYGSEASHDQSLVLQPEGQGQEFARHGEVLSSKGALHSPGASVENGLARTAQR